MKTWTDAEIATLKENYNKLPNEELCKLLPEKTWNSIYRKAYKLGLRKTEEAEFLNRSIARKGERSNFWRGGKTKTTRGYNVVQLPTHHRADKKGYVLEHIVVFEQATGILVPKNCCVHHINGDKSDNRPENLCMMTYRAHTILHHTGTKRSEETKRKLSISAKKRLENKQNHPRYKEVDVAKIQALISAGHSVAESCKILGISKYTYYERLHEKNVE